MRFLCFVSFSGNFERDGDTPGLGLVKVDIRLDTGAMLDSMVQQARMIVFKAVAKATSASDAAQLNAGSSFVKPDMGAAPSATLSGFSSALNISAGSQVPEGKHQPAHRMQKAKSSALKLNSVLQGGTGGSKGGAGLDKSRKTRSVQWDKGMDLPKVKTPSIPSPKRQRVAQTNSRLTSFKSFGRPHAGDFGSGPRNATFGDFGRKPIWGRDGKLANHPSPMQVIDDQSDELQVGSSKNTKNATFDFQRPSIHLSSGLDLGSSRKHRSSLNKVPSSIPRTATALEGWLMEKTGGK